MAESQELLILDSLIQTLRESTDLADLVGASLWMARGHGFDDDDLPAVDVNPDQTRGTAVSPRMTRYEMTVTVDIKVTHSTKDSPFRQTDPIYVAVHEAIAKDPTLGGACAAVRASDSRWNLRAGPSSSYAERTQTFVIFYEAATSDVTRKTF